MNVLKLSRNAKWYLRHPLHLLKEFVVCVKWAKQRIVRGYADRDWWDMDVWFLEVVPHMLYDMVENGCGCPWLFNSEDEWHEYLKKMADKFISITKEASEKRNEYRKAYLNNIYNQNETDDEIRHLYWERFKKIERENEKTRKEAFEMLNNCFTSLWD